MGDKNYNYMSRGELNCTIFCMLINIILMYNIYIIHIIYIILEFRYVFYIYIYMYMYNIYKMYVVNFWSTTISFLKV